MCTLLIVLLVTLPVAQAGCITLADARETFKDNFYEQFDTLPSDAELAEGVQYTYQALIKKISSEEVSLAVVNAISSIPDMTPSERSEMLFLATQGLFNLKDAKIKLNPELIARLFANVRNNEELEKNIVLQLGVRDKLETIKQTPVQKFISDQRGEAEMSLAFALGAIAILSGLLLSPMFTISILSGLFTMIMTGVLIRESKISNIQKLISKSQKTLPLISEKIAKHADQAEVFNSLKLNEASPKDLSYYSDLNQLRNTPVIVFDKSAADRIL
ncbi:MAG: hypothetical protein Q7K43_02695, partial [Candidatus Woesearchaeota archaeon]|nr:hypothetical protein [Candidatus Woesearchaeota archaeon]